MRPRPPVVINSRSEEIDEGTGYRIDRSVTFAGHAEGDNGFGERRAVLCNPLRCDMEPNLIAGFRIKRINPGRGVLQNRKHERVHNKVCIDGLSVDTNLAPRGRRGDEPGDNSIGEWPQVHRGR